MSKLETLLEQTSFLLEKQKEVKHETHRIFSELLAFVEQHLRKNAPGSDTAQILQKIHDLLSGHAQRLADEAQEDVRHLQENLEALLQIKEMSDPEKADELLASFMEDDYDDLPDVASFKKDVIDELSHSKSSLLAMVEDVKEAIKEGEAEEIALLLEAIAAEHEAEGNDEDDHEEDDVEEDDDFGGCGSCSSGGCKSCTLGSHGGKDLDFSSFLSPYEIELARDLEKEKKEKKKKS